MNDLSPSVLRRMAGAGRAETAIGPMTVPRAAGLALSRAAQDVLRVPLHLQQAEHSEVSLDAIADLLPEKALMVLLNGPGGARGIMAVDGSLLAAILQAQTTGKVTGSSVPDRAPTPTDAVLTRRFFGLFLDSLAARLEGQRLAGWARGFAPRDLVPDPKRLPHVLQDGLYGALRLTIDIGQGVRAGQLCLLLPSRGVAPVSDADAEAARAWEAAIADRVLDSAAEIEAVLMRMKLPLSKVSKLAVGDVLPFTAATLSRIRLESAGGQQVGVARLGRSNGMRAVKVISGEALPSPPGSEKAETASVPATVSAVPAKKAD